MAPIRFKVNPQLVKTSAPPIPKASAWAALYKATESEPLINLAQGVPGAPPPDEFQRRLGAAAAKSATTQYGDLRGDLGLRQALAGDVNEVYRVMDKVTAEEIVLTAGANLGFYATMVSLAQAGDEVILPTPWYFNNSMTLDQLGITTVPLPCEPPSFQPSFEQAEKLISHKTRAIILVSPNNPTGAIYPDELLHSFAELAKRRGVALVVDETYREFLKPGSPPHTLFQDDDWRSYLVHMFSFSKSYAIPGHRLGAVIASEEFLVEVHKTLDCLQICPARPAQEVVTWAIDATRPWREATRDEILKRQEVFKQLLEGVEGWGVSVGGGYFAYVKHPYAGASSELVGSRLGQYVGIVVLPGTFFGPDFENVNDDRYLRFSIANVSIDKLKLVPARLTKLNEMWDSLPSSGEGANRQPEKFRGKGSSD